MVGISRSTAYVTGSYARARLQALMVREWLECGIWIFFWILCRTGRILANPHCKVQQPGMRAMPTDLKEHANFSLTPSASCRRSSGTATSPKPAAGMPSCEQRVEVPSPGPSRSRQFP